MNLHLVHASRPIKNVQRLHAETWGVSFDQNKTDAFFSFPAGSDCHHKNVGNRGKRDKHLGAAQHISLAFFLGLEGDAGGIQAVAGFKKGQGAYGLTRGEPGQPGFFLSGTAATHNGESGQG